ncbi:hypothetical protein F66182_7782 [Fusarium sp. NRRL 66182]|nr:hypothetical protein F66182_7782 [Fusarium sp. NRRL 66182]
MKASLLILAPKGDTELVLRQPNLHIRKESNEELVDGTGGQRKDDDEVRIETTSTEMFHDRSASVHSIDDLRKLKPSNNETGSIELRFRVSSAHLTLVSPVCKAMLDGPFSEGILNQDGLYEIRASEWNAEALLIVLDIIHGHHRSVPSKIDLATLTDIAVIVDYYQCHEIMETFAEKWIAAFGDDMSQDSSQPSMSWMFIAWVFSQNSLFDKTVALSLKYGKGAVQTDLPLPSTILETLESRRQSLLYLLLDNLYGMLESLWATNDGCRDSSCSSILLGSLMKQMRQQGFDIPRPASQLKPDQSVMGLRSFVVGLSSPTWYCQALANRARGIRDVERHGCSFKDKTQPWLDDMARTYMDGVRFEDFQRRKDSSDKTPTNEA